MTFQELNLIEPLKRAVAEKGYTTPTPIQQQAIPPALEGRDLLGCAQTGTGKTAAFTLPILQLLSAEPRTKGRRTIKALVLTPTRELAIQIDECCRDYARYTDIRHCVIFGGVNQRPQVDALQRGIDLLVATPGRLLDLIGQGYVSLSDIRFFVLDEADRMLDMGFIHDIRRILPLLPEKRQTLFFSATMPDDIVKLANTMLRNPAHVTVTPPASVVETIRQSVLFAEKAEKRTLLASLLRERPESSVLVFSRTKHGADRIARILTKAGIEGRAIHGDKSQGARERAMNDFRSGACRVLIATDIAARGIDISELPLVINYDLPEVPETYVHRIGRTGRAGRDGQAIAFCSEEERPLLKDILKLTGLELDPDSGELAPAQNSRKKPAGKKPDAAQTGEQKQAEEKRAAQKQPAQSQAGQRPGRRKPQGQAPGDPKPQGQRTGGKQTPDGQQPQDKDAAARPARRRNRNRGGQKPDGQNTAAANSGRGQDGRKPGNPKPARDKRETGRAEAPRKAQTPEKKKSGMGNWLSGILRPGRK
ncbi:DEAD/DEAH box helicase [Alistipes onderdonkii]|uniref:DEAD-box ATP-dependent RNA helicase RhpA n=1 Tax=Alistipes onderdonkii TaxID=328813 RepID=A0A1Y3QZ96_9BACT|nr:DEAD/DEAH box helicase [Alistipes onderdonkii]OUN04385.1 DEAD/DEAH box helicase [Alistipes onderdonkii]